MKNMLVVEDNKSIALVIEQIGKSLGYQVTVAHSLAEVKAILTQRQDFFVASVDYSLPDAYEGQTIPYVLKHKIPCVVMTGRVCDKVHHNLLNFPIIDYITKESAQAYYYLQQILQGQLTNHHIGVLVVDDSLSVRSYVCDLLQRRNFTVYGVPDGRKALQTIKDNPGIKLVVTDYDMPGMNGVELTQTIRKRFDERDLVIIGYSALDKNYQSARFIKSGANDYIRKPFCPEEFYCRVFKNVEQIQYLDKVKTSSNIDYLTSLSNREHFIASRKADFEAIIEDKLSHLLVLFHIDGFSRLNEQYGYTIADQVLIDFSLALKDHFPTSHLARFFGAEFIGLLSATDLEQNKQQLNQALNNIQRRQISVNAQTVTYTVSLGVSIVQNQPTLNRCIEQAAEALNQAHTLGSKKVVYQPLEQQAPPSIAVNK